MLIMLPLPGGREARLSLHQRGGRQDATPLLDDGMPALPASGPVPGGKLTKMTAIGNFAQSPGVHVPAQRFYTTKTQGGLSRPVIGTPKQTYNSGQWANLGRSGMV